jgi:hypothetical protein
MSLSPLIDIQEYRVRLHTYTGKRAIQVRHVGRIPPGSLEWTPVTAQGDEFFQPAFDKRNVLNMPGPFYGAETDTCETGPMEAPNNVLLDQNGQEFIFKQPSNIEELRDVIHAARCECFCGYGGDGDDHWTLSLIREWWRGRREMLSQSAGLRGSQDSVLACRRLLAGEAEAYLRAYAYFVEDRRIPSAAVVLPELS